jgi:hypothetical protein
MMIMQKAQLFMINKPDANIYWLISKFYHYWIIKINYFITLWKYHDIYSLPWAWAFFIWISKELNTFLNRFIKKWISFFSNFTFWTWITGSFHVKGILRATQYQETSQLYFVCKWTEFLTKINKYKKVLHFNSIT